MITNEELKAISKLAEKQVELEERINFSKIALDRLNDELKQVSTIDLPAMMNEVGVDSFKLTNGRSITLKTDVFCSIPKDDNGKAFRWLRENNFDSLIKNIVISEFGKGEDEQAVEAMWLLTEAGIKAEQKESVHAMTLKAFVNEQVKAGSEIPLNLFGAFFVTKSKVV